MHLRLVDLAREPPALTQRPLTFSLETPSIHFKIKRLALLMACPCL